MKIADKPFLSLTADDVMSPTVLTIPQDMSLQGAAHLLAQARVSGAPVIDAEGRCIGVISAHDFVELTDNGACSPRRAAPTDCYCSAWQLAGDQLPQDVVRNYMTSDPVTVSPGAQIGVLAQMMVDAHIHRVIVLDRIGRPIGVVSSIDVLAAVALAARTEAACS